MKYSVILPVMNETFSLERTIEIIEKDNKDNDFEYVIITSEKMTTVESRKMIKNLIDRYPTKTKHYEQVLPFVGGAIREGFVRATGDYTVLMASDLETDPHTVKDLIKTINKGYDIVCTTRWHGGSFEGYNGLKYILNKVFQTVFRVLYGTKLTDLTFAYRIYKTEILKNIRWEELRHPFLFETIIKPLRLGYNITEVSSNWKAREEGVSQNTFMRNFEYFRIGLKVLGQSKEKIWKDKK